MRRSWLRTLLAEPAVPDPPRRVWWDWAMFAGIVLGAIGEALFRPDVVWRPVALIVCLAIAPSVLWRRSHPLLMLAGVFGSVVVLTVAAAAAGRSPVGLFTTAFFLVFVYTLFRWASGRHIVIGGAIIAATGVICMAADPGTLSDTIGGALVLALPAALGEVVRYRGLARQRLVDELASREREQLARELHDTVAHHVSAIAIQAQAGRVLFSSRPAAAVEALAVIEEAASRTLEDMRSMVKGLRNGADAPLVPQYGVEDLRRLTGSSSQRLIVSVDVDPRVSELRPSLDAAIFRIAQEAVTNAQRHAVGGSRVTVRLVADGGDVRLTITDDGHGDYAMVAPGGRSTTDSNTTGFGLLGMAERTKVLGGQFSAGPVAGSGWQVSAQFPRTPALT